MDFIMYRIIVSAIFLDISLKQTVFETKSTRPTPKEGIANKPSAGWHNGQEAVKPKQVPQDLP